MKRTPDTVSRARQRLGAEMEVWKAGIAAARRDIVLGVNPRAENLLKISFGELQLTRCRKAMVVLNKKSKGRFWKREN